MEQNDEKIWQYLREKAEEIEPAPHLWGRIKKEIAMREREKWTARFSRRLAWQKGLAVLLCLLFLGGGLYIGLSPGVRAWAAGALGIFQWEEQKQLIGHGISTGTVRPGQTVVVELYPLAKDGRLSGPIEITLAALNEDGSPGEIIAAETWDGLAGLKRFNAALPDRAPASYRLSVVAFDGRGRVIGEMVEQLNVPIQELAAALRLDKEQLRPGETLTLSIKNKGTTTVTFGMWVILEKLVDVEWVKAGELYGENVVWEDIAYTVWPGRTFSQEIGPPHVDFSRGAPGRYRIGKEVRAKGTDIKKVLYAEFTLLE